MVQPDSRARGHVLWHRPSGGNGSGTIYSFNSNDGSLTLQASFNGTSQGGFPYAGLTAISGNTYYGISSQADTGSATATFFSFTPIDGPTPASITPLGTTSAAGGNSFGAPLLGAGGRYFSITDNGGVNYGGALLAFNPSDNSLSLIHSFSSATGVYPQSLTSVGGGLFYGTTAGGGDSGNGVIFSFNSATGAVTTLASFDGAKGSTPSGALTQGAGGIFFGTTATGGDNGTGTIYSFNPATNAITLLASFDGSGPGNTTGEQSYAALTAAPDGTFYGTASVGGTGNSGTVFAFNPPPPPAPGPLPLIGAGAAFGWSRRLRLRVLLHQRKGRVAG